ncbi:MFS transporter [Streptomyces niveiscabiei]|uniref:MFS transporter n=1 Tax=Streptomyces niveiscabiei TaxID=164115 RepID=UPI000ACBF0B4|nr:MFS transporter [Streptomyces niveiscabiei]
MSEVSETEQRAVGKFLRRMMPLLVLMLLVNNLDRTNVGFIQDELKADVGVGATAYGLGAGLFFIGYALFEVPSNMLLERFGARVWLTRIMITWGAVIIAMSFIHSVTWFYVLRFLLGVAEAGFFPGAMLYITQWLPDASRGRATAIFLGGSAAAGIITGPITGALLELHGAGGFAGWRWMFALEGTFSVLVGIAAGFFLVSRIEDARWLTAEEKTALRTAVANDEDVRSRAPRTSRLRLMFHPQVALLTGAFFAMTLTGYAITFWLPSLIEEIGGLSSFQVGLLSAIPAVCSMIAMYSMSHFTDRAEDRRPYLAITLVLSAVGTYLATLGAVGVFLGVMAWLDDGFWLHPSWSSLTVFATVLGVVVLLLLAAVARAAGRRAWGFAAGALGALAAGVTASTLLPEQPAFALPALTLPTAGLALSIGAFTLPVPDRWFAPRLRGDDDRWLSHLETLLRTRHAMPRRQARAHVEEARRHLRTERDTDQSTSGPGLAEKTFGPADLYALHLTDGPRRTRRLAHRERNATTAFTVLAVALSWDELHPPSSKFWMYVAGLTCLVGYTALLWLRPDKP